MPTAQESLKLIFKTGVNDALHGAGGTNFDTWWAGKEPEIKTTARTSLSDTLAKKYTRDMGSLYVRETIRESIGEMKDGFQDIVVALHEALKKKPTDLRSNYMIIRDILVKDTDSWYARILKIAGSRVLAWGIPVASHVSAAVAVKVLEQDVKEVPKARVHFRGIFEGILAKIKPVTP